MRRLLIIIVTLAMSALAGYFGARLLHPANYAMLALAAVGGAATALLLVIIPREAWRVLRRAFMFAGLWWRRRRLRRLVWRERHLLARRAGELESPVLLRDLAVAEYLLGEAETAETELARALELDPMDTELLNNLGTTLAGQGQHDRAAEFFVRALDDGVAPEAAANCALVAPLVSEPELLEEMMSARSKKPHAMALNNLGAAYAGVGNWERARQLFRAALEEAPDLPAARANRGLVAYRRNELQEAADEVLQASKQAPDEPAFPGYLGVILAAAGQIEQARTFLRRAHRMAPASVHIRINGLAVEAMAGHWPVAVKGYQGLLGEKEHLADSYYNLSVSELASQEPAAAANSAAAAIAHGATRAEAYTILAVALRETGRRAEALSHFQTATTTLDASAAEHSNLVRALLLEKQVERAVEALQHAVGQWPEDPHLRFDMATAAVARSALRFNEQMPLLERQALLAPVQQHYGALEEAIEQQSELATEAHVNLGLYLYMQDQFERAAEHFEEAFRLTPRCRELQLLIGTALGKEGEKQTHRTEDGDTAPTPSGRGYLRRAVPYLEAACESREVLVEAAHNLGRCLYVLKEYDRSLLAFRRALKMETGDQLNSLAALAAARQAQQIQLLLKTQFMSEAKRDQLRTRSLELLNVAVHYFRQALLRNELDPTLHGNLGIAYMLRNRQNDVEAALRHWERMRAIGGGSMARRYAELAQMENIADPSRVGFDDRGATLRPIELLRWLAVAPPRPTGIRFVLEPVAVQQPWRLTAGTANLRVALALRDQIAEAELRLARLRV